MKTITTLAAIAALAASMSLANAQNATNKDPVTSPSNINKGDLPTTKSGHEQPGTQSMRAHKATTGSGAKSPAAQSQEKAASPASTDAGIKQEK